METRDEEIHNQKSNTINYVRLSYICGDRDINWGLCFLGDCNVYII
jgi:hypothetical protein